MDVKEQLVELIAKAKAMYSEDYTDHTEDEYIAETLLDNGVTVQEWISVKARLPKADGTKVIVTNGVCSWEDYLGVYDKWVVQSNSLLKKHKRPVTHWMYMPVRREVLGK